MERSSWILFSWVLFVVLRVMIDTWSSNRQAFNVGASSFTHFFFFFFVIFFSKSPGIQCSYGVYFLMVLLLFVNLTAFKKLGLDCANWPEPVYADLLRYVISKFVNSM